MDEDEQYEATCPWHTRASEEQRAIEIEHDELPRLSQVVHASRVLKRSQKIVISGFCVLWGRR
jgi:hypothetical protein